jgi:hypothetical protein
VGQTERLRYNKKPPVKGVGGKLSPNRRLKEEYSRFFKALQPQIFAHLTFRSPTTIKLAKRKLESFCKKHKMWAIAAYEKGANQVLHMHALIGGVMKDKGVCERIWQEWYKKHGRAKIEILSGGGGYRYVAKYILKDDCLEFHGMEHIKQLTLPLKWV